MCGQSLSGRLFPAGHQWHVMTDDFDAEFLETLWKRQQTGGARVIDLGSHFWILLMFELWHRTYIDSTEFLRTEETAQARA